VRLTEKPRDPALCAWTGGLLEQLVILSGGGRPTVEHFACDALGAAACLFRVSWDRAAVAL
jgi:predicted hydrocarbon binding protein